MNATDRTDQMMATVKIHRKTFVWVKKLGLHLMQRLGVVNGFILAKKYMTVAMRHKNLAEYQLLVVDRLLRLSQPRNPRGPAIQHSLRKIPSTATTPRPTKPCKWCRQQAAPGTRVSASRYFCIECPDNPGLHMGHCFEAYHAGQ